MVFIMGEFDILLYVKMDGCTVANMIIVKPTHLRSVNIITMEVSKIEKATNTQLFLPTTQLITNIGFFEGYSFLNYFLIK